MTDANEVKKERRSDLPFAYNEVIRLMKNMPPLHRLLNCSTN